jgi:hypothetical protein
MISDCFGGGSGLTGLNELAFFFDLGQFLPVVVPLAIGYTLWRIFVTNRTNPAGSLILGLDENAATYTELYSRRIPWSKLAIYVLTSAVTFKLGVIAFEAYYYLQEFLSSLSAKFIE